MNHYMDTHDLPERGKPRTSPKYSDAHKLVLRSILWHEGAGRMATDESIYDALVRSQGRVISPSGARTRRSELVSEWSYVEAATGTARTESGRTCKHWRLTEAGREKAIAERDAARQMQLDMGSAA